jgi:hypothetical protein
LSAIEKLRPVRFHWRDAKRDRNGGEQIGLIAQETEKVLPQLVTTDKGSDIIQLADGTKQTIEHLKSLDYDKLTVPLIKAVQELDAKLDALASGVTERVIEGLKDFGILIEKGVTRIAALVADRLTVGSHEHPSGITLYDDIDGAPYCVKMHAGALVSTKGMCAADNRR